MPSISRLPNPARIMPYLGLLADDGSFAHVSATERAELRDSFIALHTAQPPASADTARVVGAPLS
jgi:hypothetical protein